MAWASLRQLCAEAGAGGFWLSRAGSTSALPFSSTYSGLQQPEEREAFFSDVPVTSYLCWEETS